LQGRGAVQRFTHPGVHGVIQFMRNADHKEAPRQQQSRE
jgi:hypothetical protein